MVGSLAPRQQRSRDTEARLLAATLATLEEYGLEGATIPRIAAAAGVAPASIYRRFEDRDALYRAALRDALRQTAETSRKTVTLESFKDRTLDGVVSTLVAITAQQYRDRPGLMRALTRFIESDSSDEFRAEAIAIISANYERITDMLLAFRKEVRHRNPRRAIMFALLTMATVIEVRNLETVSMWHELMPVPDQELQSELVRSFLAYLRTSAR